mmetsp:Transcript_2987/g.6992  ORF Transcript_2987/g.6992 Transcript_2987/m.6992 type:complete len:230 (+) Transcript_2987:909-1598(+)
MTAFPYPNAPKYPSSTAFPKLTCGRPSASASAVRYDFCSPASMYAPENPFPFPDFTCSKYAAASAGSDGGQYGCSTSCSATTSAFIFRRLATTPSKLSLWNVSRHPWMLKLTIRILISSPSMVSANSVEQWLRAVGLGLLWCISKESSVSFQRPSTERGDPVRFMTLWGGVTSTLGILVLIVKRIAKCLSFRSIEEFDSGAAVRQTVSERNVVVRRRGDVAWAQCGPRG